MFCSEIFFQTTRELEYFFLSCETRNFFPQFNNRFYDKNSESDYFFFLHQNQNIFFSNIGNQNICLEKKHNPPPLQVTWSFPKYDPSRWCVCVCVYGCLVIIRKAWPLTTVGYVFEECHASCTLEISFVDFETEDAL